MEGGAHSRVVAEQMAANVRGGGGEAVLKVESCAPFRILGANAEFEAEFGLRAEEIKSRSLRLVCGPSTNILRLNALLKNAALGTRGGGLLALYDEGCNKKVMRVEVGGNELEATISMRPAETSELKPSMADDGTSKVVLSAEKLAIEYVSPEFARLFGLQQAQIVQRKLNVIYGPSTAARTVLELLAAGQRGAAQCAEVFFWDVECAEVACAVRVVPVVAPDAQVTHLLVCVEKIVKIEELEEGAPAEVHCATPAHSEPLDQLPSGSHSSGETEGGQRSGAQKRERAEVQNLPHREQIFEGPGGAKRACQRPSNTRCLLALVPALICLQQCVQPLAASDTCIELPRARTMNTLFGNEGAMQHYREAAPPLSRRRSLVFEEKMLRSHAKEVGVIGSKKAASAVLILDLDKTTIYGNDGNDLGIALQWMDKPDSAVKQLYSLLLNPNVKRAYEEMKDRADNVEVVIYTRRPQVLQYQSCFRRANIDVQYSDWHHNDELFIPETVQDAKEMMDAYKGPELLEDEQVDISKSLERLLAARDAVWSELGLITPPPVVVTAQDKQVDRIVDRLGLSADNAFLFDDNEALRHEQKVVVVEGFDALPEDRRSTLLSFLEQQLPAEEIEEELVEYLEGAKPEERAIEHHAGRVQWRVPLAPKAAAPWQMPHISAPKPPSAQPPASQPPSSWDRAATEAGLHLQPRSSKHWEQDKKLKTLHEEESSGFISPVTPSEEAESLSARPRELRAAPADLKVAAEKAFKLRMTAV